METTLPQNVRLKRKLQMALIGGGGNGFIGKVHAIAATLDGRAELVAGALSSDPKKARAAAAAFGIPLERAYGSYDELIAAEAARPAADRVDFVSIATPNYLHFPIAKLALERGFHVVCEKPLSTNLKDALQLFELARASGAVFAVAHNYSGYPLIRQAREMIRGGELGDIQALRVNYIQGGLRSRMPGQKPARGAWKSEPEKAGPAGTLADIGTHAYQLARYLTNVEPAEVSCTLQTFSAERQLDDYGHVLIRAADGALIMMTVSQVTHGRLNDLTVEVDGSSGSLLWRQEDPNQLVLRRFAKPVQIYERHPAAEYATDALRAASRLPAGHPEAFFEAFANLYRDACEDMAARRAATSAARNQRDTLYPNIVDGLLGVYFVTQCLASHQQRGAWQPLRDGHVLH